MRILVAGASGFIGGHVVRALLAAGHEVVAGVRRPQDFPRRDRCSALALDFSRPSEPGHGLPHLENIDAVINSVGILAEDRHNRFEAVHEHGPIALFEACRHAGIKRVVQISALGADETAFSRYHLSKQAADDFLAGTELDWVILQPSWAYGPGGKSLGLLAALAALPVMPVLGDGCQRLQPVAVEDVVAVVLRLLEPGAPSRVKLAVVGPRPMALAEILAVLRHWQGRASACSLSIPFPLALWLAENFGRWVATPFNGDTLRMLKRGNTGDPAALAECLGRPPQDLSAVLAAGAAPPAERRYAALRFLLPVLRWALGLLWLGSGLVSALLFPQEESYALLAGVGITGGLAPLALYGAAALDIALGIALLWRWRVPWVGAAQLGLMALYSVVIGIYLPEFLWHPFAPLLKNLPLMVATLIVIAAEDV